MTLVEATRIVTSYNAQEQTFVSPTYAINIATALKQCCDVAIIGAIKDKDVAVDIHTAKAEANLKTMIHLIQSNWKFDISSPVAESLNTNKWTKITLVPLAST